VVMVNWEKRDSSSSGFVGVGILATTV
jgi:hypothetical protein